MFLCLVPVTRANDGGPHPDYNKYVTYTVETDCTEIAIGEEITFTIKLRNHTKATFDLYNIDRIFTDIHSSYYVEEFDSELLMLKPYSSKEIVLTYTVPDDVIWHKKADGFYIEFYPEIEYGVYYKDEEEDFKELGLPHDWFVNRSATKTISIKLTNVYDGSELIDFEFIDNNEFFIYSDRADRYTKMDNTYLGEYEGEVNNFLSVTNKTEKVIEIVYIDGYEHHFEKYYTKCYIDSLESITVKIREAKLTLPKDIDEVETVYHNVMFKGNDGKYYGVTASREYKTKVCETPTVKINALKVGETELGSQQWELSFKNTSRKSIEDFFIYHGNKFPESIDDLNDYAIKDTFKAGDTWELMEPIEVPICNNKMGNDFTLLLGYWVDNSLCYWEIWFDEKETETEKVYTMDNCHHSWYADISYLDDNIKLSNLEIVLKATPTPEITSTPEPEIAAEVKQAITPTGTPQTTDVVVKEVKSYVIPPWVYVVLSLAFLAVVGVVVFKMRSGDNDCIGL